MEQLTRFQKLVARTKRRIAEISPAQALMKSKRGGAVLIDVREENEWLEEHVRNAVNLSRGAIELEIEERIPDIEQPIICYCGGGSRSALVAESLQKMGYKNVYSMTGGFRAWLKGKLPTE